MTTWHILAIILQILIAAILAIAGLRLMRGTRAEREREEEWRRQHARGITSRRFDEWMDGNARHED